tara:strand:+ start:574 stop:762 length:189 start_codon:yes stop_codon:yes gene_type:complete
MAFMITKEYIQDTIKSLDLGMHLLRVQFYLALAFSYIAKSIYSVFFYKSEKKKSYDEDELFI